MKNIKILITILLVGFFIGTACVPKKTPVQPTAVPATEESYPPPEVVAPTAESYPAPAPQAVTSAGYPEPEDIVITPANAPLVLSESAQYTPGFYGIPKWCTDQTCIMIIGFDDLLVISYPGFDEIFKYHAEANEPILDASSSGKNYLTTGDFKELVIQNWETSARKTIQVAPGFMDVKFSPDGKQILITSPDEWKAQVYDVETGSLIATITGFETAAPVYDLRYGQNNQFAVWIARATVQVSDIATNQIYPAIFHEDFVMAMDINAQGTMLATAAAANVNDEFLPTIFLFDIKTGETIKQFTVEGGLFDLKFSPDGNQIACSFGNDVKLYDLEGVQQPVSFVAFSGNASRVLFSPDGTILMVSDDDSNLHFFNLK